MIFDPFIGSQPTLHLLLPSPGNRLSTIVIDIVTTEFMARAHICTHSNNKPCCKLANLCDWISRCGVPFSKVIHERSSPCYYCSID